MDGVNRERLARKVRRANITERLYPARRALHDQGVYTAIDTAGRPVREAYRSILPPQVLVWGPSADGAIYVPRAGLATLVTARAGTAPTTGTATFTVFGESEFNGSVIETVVNMTVGRRFGEAQVIDAATGNVGVLLPAGSWILRDMTDAQGATAVSVALVIEAR